VGGFQLQLIIVINRAGALIVNRYPAKNRGGVDNLGCALT